MRGLIASFIWGVIWGIISAKIGVKTDDPTFYIVMVLGAVMVTLLSPKNNNF